MFCPWGYLYAHLIHCCKLWLNMVSKSGRTTNFKRCKYIFNSELQNPNGIKREMNQIQRCLRRLRLQSKKEHGFQSRGASETNRGISEVIRRKEGNVMKKDRKETNESQEYMSSNFQTPHKTDKTFSWFMLHPANTETPNKFPMTCSKVRPRCIKSQSNKKLQQRCKRQAYPCIVLTDLYSKFLRGQWPSLSKAKTQSKIFVIIFL